MLATIARLLVPKPILGGRFHWLYDCLDKYPRYYQKTHLVWLLLGVKYRNPKSMAKLSSVQAQRSPFAKLLGRETIT